MPDSTPHASDRTLVRSLLLSPLSPQEPGNGLARRARSWQEALGRLGPCTTLVLPVAGPARPDDGCQLVTLMPPGPGVAHLPGRARGVPEVRGRQVLEQEVAEQVDVVVALRVWTAPFGLGAAAVTGARLVVDLDDDDVSLLAELGEQEEARRVADLVEVLRRRADLLTSATGFAGTARVPNSVHRPVSPRREPAEEVLLVGNFGYGPNVEGARWFLDEVLPLVQEAVPGAHAVVVGPGSDQALPGTGLGFVPDLADAYARAAVAVVPLLHGSGTRLKALEAFAHGAPVVGTVVGLHGLDVEDGVSALVRDDPGGFADAVVHVLQDPDLARRLSEGGRELSVRWDADQVAESTATLVRALVDRPADATRFAQAPSLTLVEEDDGLVVLEEDGLTAHHLNPFAAAVLTLVDEPRNRQAVVAEAATWFPGAEDLSEAVDQALASLRRAGLVQTERTPEGS